MDWRSLTGIVVAIGAVAIGQGADGGRLVMLWQPAGLAVVLGGCTGALLLQCGPVRIVDAIRLLRDSFSSTSQAEPDWPLLLRQWSATARRSGLLALDGEALRMDDRFVARGLRLLADSIAPAHLAEVLEGDTEAFAAQRRQAIRIWESAGGTAPTMGILGAVLGLVQVMQHLSDPSQLGPGIAVAFVATLYGVGFANLVFLPVANRMQEQLADELRRRDLLAAALVAIAAGEPGYLIDERMADITDTADDDASPPALRSRKFNDPVPERREPAIAPPR